MEQTIPISVIENKLRALIRENEELQTQRLAIESDMQENERHMSILRSLLKDAGVVKAMALQVPARPATKPSEHEDKLPTVSEAILTRLADGPASTRDLIDALDGKFETRADPTIAIYGAVAALKRLRKIRRRGKSNKYSLVNGTEGGT